MALQIRTLFRCKSTNYLESSQPQVIGHGASLEVLFIRKSRRTGTSRSILWPTHRRE